MTNLLEKFVGKFFRDIQVQKLCVTFSEIFRLQNLVANWVDNLLTKLCVQGTQQMDQQ